MLINYNGRTFKGITNSPNGQVSGDTVFHYAQQGTTLTATYSGGSIREGHLLGIVHDDNSLRFVYHHLDMDGNLKSGICTSVPEILNDGRIRLHESWQWTNGSDGVGESVIEEISIR